MKTKFTIKDLLVVVTAVSVCMAFGALDGDPATVGLNLAILVGFYTLFFRAKRYEWAWHVFCAWMAAQHLWWLAIRWFYEDARDVKNLTGWSALSWYITWAFVAYIGHCLFSRREDEQKRPELVKLTIISILMVVPAFGLSIGLGMLVGSSGLMGLNVAVLAGFFVFFFRTQKYEGAWYIFCAWMAAQPIVWFALSWLFVDSADWDLRGVDNLINGRALIWWLVWSFAAFTGNHMFRFCKDGEKRPVLVGLMIVTFCFLLIAGLLYLWTIN